MIAHSKDQNLSDLTPTTIIIYSKTNKKAYIKASLSSTEAIDEELIDIMSKESYYGELNYY